MRRQRKVLLAALLATGAIAFAACNPSAGQDSSSRGVCRPRIFDTTPNALTDKVDLDFGTTFVGARVDRQVSIQNELTHACTISQATFSGSLASAFSFTYGPIVLNAGDPVTYHVGFLPTAPCEFSGLITLPVVDGDVPALTIRVHGIGIQPDCKVSAQVLDFGITGVDVAYPRSLEILNRSTIPIPLTLADPVTTEGGATTFVFRDGFKAGEHVVPPADADGTPGALEVPIAFKPHAEHEYSGVLQVLAPAFCPSSVALHGTGIAHVLQCEPNVEIGGARTCRVDFGMVGLARKAMRPVTFKNLGNLDVTLTLFSVIQPPIEGGPYAIESAMRTVTVPAGGGTATFDLSFLPTALGEQFGRLTFTSDSPDTPSGTVDLVGIGGGPIIDVRPSQLDYGKVAVNTYQTRRVTIANVGNDLSGRTDDNLLLAELTGSDWTERRAEITGTDAADFSVEWPPQGYSAIGLAEGQNAELPVRFAPLTPGPKNALLVIYSNDATQPTVQVALSGLAVDLPPCDYEIRPSALNFGTVETDRNLNLSFAIVNRDPDATHECLVGMVELTLATRLGGAFSLVNGPLDSATLPGGESLVIPVRFHPRADGNYTGEVAFYISGPNSAATVSLNGTAQPSCLMISSREVDFGTVGISCSSRQRTVTLYNTCTPALTVTGIDARPGTSAAFTVLGRPALPVTIAGGSSSGFDVVYRPTSAGPDLSSVAVTVVGIVSPFVVSLSGSGATDPLQTDIFSRNGQSRADVLLVINDGLFANEQASVARNFAWFIRPAQQRGVDYHLAITTTNLASTGPGGFGTCSSSSTCGRFVPVYGANSRVITDTTPNKEQIFSQNVQVGSNGASNAPLIRPAYLALTSPLLSGHNAGFYRDDAQLAVAVIAQSADIDPLPTPVSFYERYFVGLKGERRRNDVSFSGIIPSLVDPPVGCSSWTSLDAGQDTRVKTLAQNTGGLVQEICSPDYSKMMETLGEHIFGARTTWFLANTPTLAVANPFTVTVDGLTVAQFGSRGEKRWDYDANLNAIVFSALEAPDPSSTLSISYHVACL